MAPAGSTSLNYNVAESLGSVGPGELWPAGVEIARLDSYLDRVTALCHVGDPAVARDRARSLARAVDATVDAGVTLDPDVVEERSDLCALVDALEEAVDGRLSVYHHELMTARQREWVETALDE